MAVTRKTKETISQTTLQTDNEVKKWFHNTPPSTGTLRLLLCADLTVVQGALLSSWSFVAWVLGLQTLDLHQLAVYGGIFCIQYLLVSILRVLHAFIDGWNQMELNRASLSSAKRPLDVVVNVVGRIFIWLLLMGVALFSGFQLRVVPMNSFINCVISGCSFGNFILIIHVGGTILTDCDSYNKTKIPDPNQRRQSNGVVVRMSIGIWSMIIQAVLIGCQAVHLASHLWPLADTLLVSCLVALGVYMSRRHLDETLNTSAQVQNARTAAHESRHLIWPVIILLINYVCDVIMAILRLTQEYAIKFLISVSNVGNENKLKKESSDGSADEEVQDTEAKDESNITDWK